MMLSLREIERQRIWPAWLIALLAVIQLLLTFAIIGLESTSIAFDAWHSMSYAGFYCPLFFMVTWISMFTVTCCNRGSFGCAIHVLVENIISIIAAAVLLYFNNLFLNNPYTCLFGSTYECSRSYYDYSSYYGTYYNSSTSSVYGIYSTTGHTVKLACIKAELACAAVTLTTCVIYLIIFTVIAVRVRNIDNESRGMPHPPTSYQPPHFQAPSIAPTAFSPVTIKQNPTSITCPNCHVNIPIQGTIQLMIEAGAPAEQPHFPSQTVPSVPPQLPFPIPPPPPPAAPVTTHVPLPSSTIPAFGLSDNENSWRSKFPKLFSLILGIIQSVLIALILILEIASLAIAVGFKPTGVGIWSAIPFSIAAAMKIKLEYGWERSRLWATRVLIAEIVLLVFTFILIGITGDYVANGGYLYSSSSYSYLSTTATTTYTTKYQITQAQLAFGILLMFSGWTYVGVYIYVTVVALWKPYNTLDLPHLFKE